METLFVEPNQITKRSQIIESHWYVVRTDDGVYGSFRTKRLAMCCNDGRGQREGFQCYRTGSHSYVMSGRAVLLQGWLEQ